MADIIQLLPDHVANQIAAGEVVQRPASVVKELLENAIDAGASVITLQVKDAGKTLIQVLDNGIGMSTTDVRMCFERHATSKIKSAEDLFQLQTKGFRGEALASIAAIAQVEVKTKQENEELGTLLTIAGSKVENQQATVTPKGTSIAVKNLFFNIPARRNFLKSNTVELRHIIDEFHRVALAHENVAFTFIHNDATIFNLPISNLKQRIVSIFGTKSREKLVPVQEETEILKINGFVLKPSFARKSRGEQFFFVNNRFIKSSYLNHAVVSAFEGLINDGTHPGYFLFLEVNPQSIDINIHPTKTEIKFEDEHAIYAMLRATIKHSLGQFSIVPTLDFSDNNTFNTPYSYSKKEPIAPTIEVDRDFNPFKESGRHGGNNVSYKPKKETQWESLYVGLQSDATNDGNLETNLEFESEEVTGELFDNEEESEVRTTFQLQQKYIVSPIKSGLMIVHQNLAHQRVLYEELLKNITVKEAASQQLLFPLELSFSKPRIRLLVTVKEQLEQTGFIFSISNEENVNITGIPTGIMESAVPQIINTLFEDLENDIPEAGFYLNDALAKSMAKSMAVKTGTTMLKKEQEHLIHQLFACKEPAVSPTNKTVFVTLDATDFDKHFM